MYDGIGEAFESFKTLPIIRYTEVPGFLALVGDVTGKSVLDIACGTGFYSRELKRRGASRVFGFDISSAMIDAAEARERSEPLGIAYEVGDTATLRTFDQPFDVAVAVQAFNYATDVAEIEQMMRNVRRSLVAGGAYFLFAQNPGFDFDGPSLAKYGFLCKATGKDNAIWPGNAHHGPAGSSRLVRGHHAVEGDVREDTDGGRIHWDRVGSAGRLGRRRGEVRRGILGGLRHEPAADHDPLHRLTDNLRARAGPSGPDDRAPCGGNGVGHALDWGVHGCRATAGRAGSC
ncbi:class I SAM-dependent methyltransferase [Streptomyces sp. NBC_01310]|nr:class I SAM-dependent methyltransferase [Streptomyces sp. NBC_01310]